MIPSHPPLHKSVLLPCSQEEAFRLFCDRINDWWPVERRHLDHPESVISLGPERFYESDPTGRTLELGKVREWKHPERISIDWYPGTGPEQPTAVEVRFVPQAASTRVEIVHGPGPNSLEAFPLRAPRYDASWDLVLAALLHHA